MDPQKPERSTGIVQNGKMITRRCPLPGCNGFSYIRLEEGGRFTVCSREGCDYRIPARRAAELQVPLIDTKQWEVWPPEGEPLCGNL